MEQIHQGLEPVEFLPYIDENRTPLDDEEYLNGLQDEMENYPEDPNPPQEEVSPEDLTPPEEGGSPEDLTPPEEGGSPEGLNPPQEQVSQEGMEELPQEGQ